VARASIEGVRLKIKRADKYLKELDGELARFFQDEVYGATIDFKQDGPNSGWVTITVAIRKRPRDEWGLIVGDYIHNLSSALDHLVWQLRRLNGGRRARRSGFPAARSRWRFAYDDIEAMLAGLSERHRAMIEGLQPFRGWDRARFHPLVVIRRLSSIDKHRFVHPVHVWVAANPPDAAGLGITYDGTIGERESFPLKAGEPVKDGTPLMRFHVSGVHALPPDVNVEGKIPMDVAFGQRGLIVKAETIRDLTFYVERVYQLFKPEFG
jgi:hypothetical protein